MKTQSLILALLINGLIASFGQDGHKMQPKDTEDWSKKPAVVKPGRKMNPPSDAIVLFNGKNLDKWKKQGTNEAAGWKVKGNKMQVSPQSGGIESREKFGDCQLHIEWKTPTQDVKAGKKGQKCGNSGIFLMGLYEVQVLNSFENETYYNGMASSIYKQHIPLVNASLKPGKWQSYDIIFTAPTFNANKTLKSPAFITVIHNGILVQNHVEIKGSTTFIGHPSYKYHEAKRPISLQDHNNKVCYRNIWIREL